MVPRSQAGLLVLGDWVVIEPDQILRHGAVVITGETISEVGPAEELVQKYPTLPRIGGEQRLILPGLVNTHTHLFQTFLKGLGQGMLLRPWIRQVTTPAALAMTEREAYLSAMIGLIEAVRSGTTSVFEYSYAFPRPGLHEAILQAFVDIGVRGWLGLGLNDSGQQFGVNPAFIQPLSQCLQRLETLHRQVDAAGQGRVVLALTPSSTRGLTLEGLRTLRDYARAHGLILSLHINETGYDDEAALARYGLRTIPWLAEMEILGPEFLAVHCVQMQAEDIALLAATQASVSHNPVSNMYLGSGIAPVAAMRQAGVTVGLGTDGAASNNSQDMIETMKLAALGQRAAQSRPDALNAAEVVAMATVTGAEALGRPETLGRLRPGYQADLAVIRLDTAKALPVHDPLASLVFSAGEENVETVIVAGQTIMQAGRLTSVDEAALLAEAQTAARDLVTRAGITQENL